MRLGSIVFFVTLAGLGSSSVGTAPRARAQAPITTGTESALDLPIAVPAESRASVSRRTCGATTCIVVWNEPDEDQSQHVHSARFRASDGAPLDGPGTVLDETDDGQTDADVVTDGTSFFVVWSVESLSEIHGTRVDATTGARVGGVVVIARGGSTAVRYPRASFDGTRYVVAWAAAGAGLRGVRVRPSDGAVLDPVAAQLVGSADADRFGITFDGENHVLAFGRGDTLLGARVRPSDLVSLDPSGFAIAVTGAVRTGAPSIASEGGRRSLVVWSDARATVANSPRVSQAFGARIGASGELPDGNGFLLTTRAGNAAAPQVAFDGTNYVVGWEQLGDRVVEALAARIRPDATSLDPAGVKVGEFAWRPYQSADTTAAVAALGAAVSGTRLLFSWREGYVVRGGRLAVAAWDSGLNGPAAPTSFLAVRASAQSRPAVALAGGIALVVFVDSRRAYDPSTSGDLSSALFARRVRASDGAVLDSQAFAVSAAPGQRPDFAVAASGDRFLIAYTDWNVLRGVLVRASDGAVVASGFPICDVANADPGDPAIASDGTSFLVAWSDMRAPGVTQDATRLDVYGTVVASDGTVADTSGTAIDTGVAHSWHPTVAWNGTEYLVAFFHWGLSTNRDDIQARRLSATGSTKGVTFTLVTDITRAGSDLAFGGGRYVLGYRKGGSALVQWLDSTGTTVGSPVAIGTLGTPYGFPRVAFDGTEFFASFIARTGPTSLQHQGSRLGTIGTVVDATPASLGADVGDQSGLSADVERLGTSRYLLAYDRFDVTPGTSNLRVFARVVTAAAPPPATDGGTGSGGGGTGSGIQCGMGPSGHRSRAELAVGLLLAGALVVRARRRRDRSPNAGR